MAEADAEIDNVPVPMDLDPPHPFEGALALPPLTSDSETEDVESELPTSVLETLLVQLQAVKVALREESGAGGAALELATELQSA